MKPNVTKVIYKVMNEILRLFNNKQADLLIIVYVIDPIYIVDKIQVRLFVGMECGSCPHIKL